MKKFDGKEKLSPLYIGPFEVLKKTSVVAYRIILPPKLVGIHKSLSIISEILSSVNCIQRN